MDSSCLTRETRSRWTRSSREAKLSGWVMNEQLEPETEAISAAFRGEVVRAHEDKHTTAKGRKRYMRFNEGRPPNQSLVTVNPTFVQLLRRQLYNGLSI